MIRRALEDGESLDVDGEAASDARLRELLRGLAEEPAERRAYEAAVRRLFHAFLRGR